jgi:hypothetical protein
MIKVARCYLLGILLEMLIYNPKKYKGGNVLQESVRDGFGGI